MMPRWIVVYVTKSRHRRWLRMGCGLRDEMSAKAAAYADRWGWIEWLVVESYM